jgi:hypothetical protein
VRKSVDQPVKDKATWNLRLPRLTIPGMELDSADLGYRGKAFSAVDQMLVTRTCSRRCLRHRTIGLSHLGRSYNRQESPVAGTPNESVRPRVRCPSPLTPTAC